MFDNNEKGVSDIPELVNQRPTWPDDYSVCEAKSGVLDRLIDTPFAVVASA